MYLKAAAKAAQFGSINTISAMIKGGTFVLAGTSQGQVLMFHIDIQSG